MTNKDTASFFENGTTEQFEYCFKLYPQALKLKAEKRCKKPQELIRLDEWYQNELPKLIKARGKDAHMIYDELVQTMKWKQSRGKFYPQLSYLVKVNTPRAVMQETKKAFRKLPNLEQAITALSNLKGVGTTMASALLAAAAPDSAPFMADECLMAIPEIEGIDYTTKEYLNFVQHIQSTVERLNAEAGGGGGGGPTWSPHRVELALWAHYVANDLNPELLDQMPSGGSKTVAANGSGMKTMVSVAGDSMDADDATEKVMNAVGEDTNDGDDTNESMAAARGGETNTATESETTDNENTNPIPTILVNNVSSGVLQDGDSNFVSNDSTSQEDVANANIIDEENTTQTTATTSTDDGEAGTNTPLASDSESNIEAPLKSNNNNIAAAASSASASASVSAANRDVKDADNAMTSATNRDSCSNSNSNSNSNGDTSSSKLITSTEAVGHGNGNGTLLVVGGIVNDSLDGDNSSCLRSSANEASEGYDEYDESNSNSVSGKCVALKSSATAIVSENEKTTLCNAAQKRSMLQCNSSSTAAEEEEEEEEPDFKKVRND